MLHVLISGRILNRFSKDIGCVDELLPPTFYDMFAVITISILYLMMRCNILAEFTDGCHQHRHNSSYWSS